MYPQEDTHSLDEYITKHLIRLHEDTIVPSGSIVHTTRFTELLSSESTEHN
jgi:hypothetical protein